jgi:predicted membrane-bound mannosyltransferase
VGFISTVIYLIVAIVMLADLYTVAGVFMLVDVFAVGGLSVAMYMKKQAWPFIAFAAYNVIASILAFISYDFSNLLWLVVSIYVAVKMWKVDQAYQAYLQTGRLPEGAL